MTLFNQQFGTYIDTLPTALPISSEARIYLRQGGNSYTIPISALLSTGSVSINGTLSVTNDGDQAGIQSVTYGYDGQPAGSILGEFNLFQLNDASPTAVAKCLLAYDIMMDGWGASNVLLEKICFDATITTFAIPTGSGPHQMVAISGTSYIPGAVGACPTVDLFAENLITLVQSGASCQTMIGSEIDMVIESGASAGGRVGVQVVGGPGSGTNNSDTCFVVGGDGIGGGRWDFGYYWYPLSFKSTSTIFGSLQPTPANIGLDLSAVTLTTAAIRSPGFFVGPLGDVFGVQLAATGDFGGTTPGDIALTNVSNVTANSTGVGTILFKGTTSRNSAGFIKIYVGTTPYFVPLFAAITG